MQTRILIPVFIVLLVIWAVISAARAWHIAEVREAYLPELERFAHEQPGNGPLFALLGARLAEARDYQISVHTLQHAIAEGDNDPEVWLTMAGAAAAAGHRALATGILKTGSGRSVTGLQDAAERVQRLPKSARPLDVASAISPAGPSHLADLRSPRSFLSGIIEWWGRRHPESSGFATRSAWVRQEPDNPQAARLWAVALTTNRDFLGAGRAMQRALLLAPQSAETHLAAAHLLMSMGREDMAGAEYAKCLQIRPQWLPALLGEGQVALDRKLIPTSIQMFEAATQQEPKSAEAWIGLGRAYLNQPLKLSESLSAFKKAESLSPGSSDYFDDYASALDANYQPDTAEKLLRRRLQLAPEDTKAHFLLALLLVTNRPNPQRQAEAESELRTVLRLAPHTPDAQTQLAKILLAQNKIPDAITLLQDARANAPFYLLAATTLARAYLQAGQPEKAQAISGKAATLGRYLDQLQFLQGAIQHNPGDAGVRLQLANLYESTGQTQKALEQRTAANWLQNHPGSATSGADILSLPEPDKGGQPG